eukprot:GFKZ01013083.1.p2 GENE.GFKZ01013083.1~~GFKZ01013083.1.p2  ORF type:complete len:152 (+),score=15.56 GFKZ01013083.1:257-712(+)
MAPQLFLKTLQESTAVVSSASTAQELHRHARDIHSLDTPLRLVHAGHDIPDDQTPLNLLGIADNSNITALARLLGGGKKRKKKTYTKPKKIKHKHKTVKFGVLKYYKVTDGKVERLRRECPADICGAGVFMAAHADRVYCGKCALTYVHEK